MPRVFYLACLHVCRKVVEARTVGEALDADIGDGAEADTACHAERDDSRHRLAED